MSRQRSSIEWQDIVAATYVVGTDLIECDYLDPTEAYSNLPNAPGQMGGEIFVLPGTYTLATTVPLGGPTGVPVVWRGSGAGSTIFDIGSAAIAPFTILDGSPARMVFGFSGMEFRGDGLTAGQSAIAYQDTTSFAVVEGKGLLVEGTLETFFDIQAFDTTFTRPFSSTFAGSRIVPPSGIPGEIVKCFNPAGTNSAISRVEFLQCDSGGVLGAAGWSIDADIALVCDDTFVNLTVPSAVTTLNTVESLFLFMNGSDDFEVYVGDNFGPGNGCVGTSFISFAGDARLVLKYGAQFFDGCQFGAVKVLCETQVLPNVPFFFTGCNFATGGTESTGLEFDTIIGAVVSGCFFNGWTTEGVRIHDSSKVVIGRDCVFVPAAGANTVVEDGTSDGNEIDGLGLGLEASVTVVGASTVLQGSKLSQATTVATTDGFVAAGNFPHVNAKGLIGWGTIKNNGGGGKSMVVRETVGDTFGNTVTQDTTVADGADLPLTLYTQFGAARPPYTTYSVEVKSSVAGNPTTYSMGFTSRGAV